LAPLFGAGAASSSFAPPQATNATQAASIASLLFVINRFSIYCPCVELFAPAR
jgi:hypothetical protein